VFWTMWNIVHLIIERFEIQSFVSFVIVNVVCKEFNNVSIYGIIRDKLVKNNNMLSSVLIE
jgi:hypothetical protein